MPSRSLLLSTLTILIISSLLPTHSLAQTMESVNYRIRFGNFNITSGTKTSGNYTLTDTVGQTAAQEFTGAGYTVKAGFQYIYALYDFTFTISDLSIDFGSLTPNTFSTQTNQLTISAPGSSGYSIRTHEDHRLQNAGGSFIADTSCDSACTHTSAATWTNTANVGFGFNIQGDDAPSIADVAADFSTANHYRQFADVSLGDSPALIMSSTTAARSRSATVTYKVNISGSQASGDYENIIIYTATPGY